ncbi:MAG: hypothetical protein ACYC69_02825 [Thermodesulfovibrionales bacterium]
MHCNVPDSIDSINQGECEVYGGAHIFSIGIPYIIITRNLIRGKGINEGFVVVPERLFDKIVGFEKDGQTCAEIFRRACHVLNELLHQLPDKDSSLFPEEMSFRPVDQSSLIIDMTYETEEYPNRFPEHLAEVSRLTDSDVLKTLIHRITYVRRRVVRP